MFLIKLLLAHCVFSCFNIFGAASSGGVHWTYDEVHGPTHWCQMDPHSQCCGDIQSPIDIDEFEVKLEMFSPLVFTNYSYVPSSMPLSNNGHTIVLTMGANDTAPGFTGGGLKDYFIFDSLHFHWGKDSSVGSEHTIDGKHYPLELHMVHFNSKYETKDKALVHTDGLAVLGILYKISDKDNEALKGVVKALDEVRYANDESHVRDPISLQKLLPPSTGDFYRYQGSLTTPPCSEIVTWTVLDSHAHVSEAQLTSFRKLRIRSKTEEHADDADADLVNNFRPTQSLRGRRVHARSTLAKIRASKGGAGPSSAPAFGLLPAALLLGCAALGHGRRH